MIRIPINTDTIKGYDTLLKCKSLPKYHIEGSTVVTDQHSYNYVFGGEMENSLKANNKIAFDYQIHIVNKALEAKKFAAFADCGLGKMLMGLLWTNEVLQKGKVLFTAPLSVIQEFYNDVEKFNFSFPISNLRKGESWNEGVGVINFESLKDIDLKGVAGIWLDESSILKNADGKTKDFLCKISNQLEYRLATSATPAPNDQSEYATHSVFLGYDRTEKEFYSRFFRKDGNKWKMKKHAVNHFYDYLKSWCCYLHDPRLLGFECGGYLDEKPEYIIKKFRGGEDLMNGLLFSTSNDLKQAQAVFRYRSKVNTDRFNYCIENALKYKSIVWCNRNDQEKVFSKEIGKHCLITGSTPIDKRVEIINAFRNGEINNIISKAKILGWGVNLQQAEAHIDTGYDYSFEAWYQKMRRSHRYGRTGVLKYFMPAIEAEMPFLDNIFNKLKTFENDVIQLQGRFFKES